MSSLFLLLSPVTITFTVAKLRARSEEKSRTAHSGVHRAPRHSAGKRVVNKHILKLMDKNNSS